MNFELRTCSVGEEAERRKQDAFQLNSSSFWVPCLQKRKSKQSKQLYYSQTHDSLKRRNVYIFQNLNDDYNLQN